MGDLFELYQMIFEHGCTDEQQLSEKLNKNMQITRFKRGQSIAPIYKPAKKSFLVYDGQYSEFNYSADGDKILMAVRSAPQLIGIVALVEKNTYYKTDMIASGDVKAVEIDNDYFYKELERDGMLGILIIKNLTTKIAFASHRMRCKRFFDAQESLIIYLYEELRKCQTAQDSFCLVRSNRLISEELDISERTLYRALDNLKRTRRLSVVDGKIYLNAQQIRDVALFYENAFGGAID